MSTQRFTLEFKEEAVKQVVECCYSVPDVAARLGISAHSPYKWVGEALDGLDAHVLGGGAGQPEPTFAGAGSAERESRTGREQQPQPSGQLVLWHQDACCLSVG